MLLFVDLDGVVYRGAEPVPGVAALLAERAKRGDDIVYVTNNSMFYRADYVTRLAGMGAPVSADRVVSSSRDDRRGKHTSKGLFGHRVRGRFGAPKLRNPIAPQIAPREANSSRAQ